MNQQYMTVTEAAKVLGVTGRTVQRYIHRGLFPGAYQLPGGSNMPWLIPADEVRNFIKPERKK
jgi:excisionase family DNA binding protein